MPETTTDLSVATIAALAAGGALLIGAFFAGIVSVVTAWRTIVSKVTAIEGHVNSEKTAGEGRENTLKSENALLREMLADRKATAALLAQASATRGRGDTASVDPMPKAGTVLDQIETNTAKTVEAAQNLKA